MNRRDLIKIIRDKSELGVKYHILKTGVIPDVITIYGFDNSKWEKFRAYIEDEFSWEKENKFQHDRLTLDKKNMLDYTIHLNSHITISRFERNNIELLFNDNSDQQILSDIKDKFLKLRVEKGSNQIGIIQSFQGDLMVRFCEYKLFENDLFKYFDDETRAFFEQMSLSMQRNQDKGLYLLHGKPGTGKTTFIKKILSETDKKALYISPSIAQELTSPHLISLMIDYPDSILVIEDAETVLMERKADNSSAVSNLLNLTDGFLSDFLNLKVICTFNTPLKNIDSALLRGGRLKGMHEFKELSSDNVQKIASTLGIDIPPSGPMTIAEICNTKTASKTLKPKKIGFGG